jgi:glycogen(starch) synthase
LHVLHLGFEDHRRPGAGGGSHRSHQINRRLVAHGHHVDVVTAAYPRAEARIEDGVHYRQIGDGRGYFRSIVTYHARLAPLVARVRLGSRRPDVVVEEFAPPFSTLGFGALAGAPSVGNVQGFFAAHKAREYGVPVSLLTAIERRGTRRHGYLIALSRELADELRVAAPDAHVVVNGMGVPHHEIADALSTPTSVIPGRIVFLGRLEVAQKGIDLLLAAMRDVVHAPDTHLLLAGDGRDSKRVEEMAHASGLEDRVRLIGRISGAEKWRLLASAQVCVMPSRYETFGLSALEALACGTPVVGFDIPCLHDTVPGTTGRLVAPFDVRAFGTSLGELLAEPRLCKKLGDAGIEHARVYTWEAVAAAQLAVYEAAAKAAQRSPRLVSRKHS